PTSQYDHLSLHDALPISRSRRTTKGGIQPDVKRAEEIWNSEFGIWNSRGESTRYAQHLGVELIVGLTQTNRGLTRMAYIFHQDQDRKSTRLNSSHDQISY